MSSVASAMGTPPVGAVRGRLGILSPVTGTLPRMTASNDVVSVERMIPAPPEKIFDLLADPARHRDIDGSGTVRDAKSGSERLALGRSSGCR